MQSVDGGDGTRAAIVGRMKHLPGLASRSPSPSRSPTIGGADETFSCRPSVLTDGRWECTWSVWEKASAADADDPCAGGTGFQTIAQVNADGTLVAGQMVCVAPG